MSEHLRDAMIYGLGIDRGGERIDPTKVYFRTGLPPVYLNRPKLEPEWLKDIPLAPGMPPSPVFRLKAGEGLNAKAMVDFWRNLYPAISASWLTETLKEEPMNYTIHAATDGGHFVQEGNQHRDDYGRFLGTVFAGTLDECLKYVSDRFKAVSDGFKAAEAAEAARREAEAVKARAATPGLLD